MDKLQELTDKLYKEGLSKGKKEGAEIIESAKTQAGDIIDDAYRKHDAIIAKARKEADDITSKATSDLRLAGKQALQALRQDIEGLIVTQAVTESTDKALASTEFVRDIILEVARKFNAAEPCDLALVLPESQREALGDFVGDQIRQTLGRGIDVTFSRKISGGFHIGPKDGGYFISLTDETFKALISEYLRPTTKKLLFGE